MRTLRLPTKEMPTKEKLTTEERRSRRRLIEKSGLLLKYRFSDREKRILLALLKAPKGLDTEDSSRRTSELMRLVEKPKERQVEGPLGPVSIPIYPIDSFHRTLRVLDENGLIDKHRGWTRLTGLGREKALELKAEVEGYLADWERFVRYDEPQPSAENL